jgi:hypothetical protein
MSDMRRLLDESNDERLLAVLRSNSDLAPPPKLRGRTLAAVGLHGGVLGAAGSWVSSALGVVATHGWVGSLAKGALIVGVGTAAVIALRLHRPATLTINSAARVEVPQAPVAPLPARERVEHIPLQASTPQSTPTVADPGPTIHSRTEAHREARVPTPTPKQASNSASLLAAEVSTIDAARTALSAGSAARALGELDRYDREFPAGVLGPEATVLRIEALVRQGNLKSARALATGFLATHRRSPHAARIHSLLGDATPL